MCALRKITDLHFPGLMALPGRQLDARTGTEPAQSINIRVELPLIEALGEHVVATVERSRHLLYAGCMEETGGLGRATRAAACQVRVRALLVAYDAEWDSKEGMICKESAVARDLKEGGYAAYWTGCAMRLSEADLNQPFDKVIIDRCFAELRNGSLTGVKCAALCGPVQVSGRPNMPILWGKIFDSL